ncbi:hypothetical protein Mnod_1423 [Methylobacterium nodulans ORS 2060]|uniref:Uncharacterized protein n=1 Tax=Methylobacterium nodulans (strain LMG 21967 / CNCM I-2342 / ORS 2060) TaxID=460265 RepID=B8IM76_METNO|nr:hypothetical protein Mnod_1423 [Methylobacterium nodulans ORS 2060]
MSRMRRSRGRAVPGHLSIRTQWAHHVRGRRALAPGPLRSCAELHGPRWRLHTLVAAGTALTIAVTGTVLLIHDWSSTAPMAAADGTMRPSMDVASNSLPAQPGEPPSAEPQSRPDETSARIARNDPAASTAKEVPVSEPPLRASLDETSAAPSTMIPETVTSIGALRLNGGTASSTGAADTQAPAAEQPDSAAEASRATDLPTLRSTAAPEELTTATTHGRAETAQTGARDAWNSLDTPAVGGSTTKVHRAERRSAPAERPADASGFTLPSALQDVSSPAASSGETSVTFSLGAGFVRGTSSALAAVSKPLEASPGRNRVVAACRQAVESEAFRSGARQVEVVSAGQDRRARSGRLSAPVHVRITYDRFLGSEVREATMICVLDRTGRVVEARL